MFDLRTSFRESLPISGGGMPLGTSYPFGLRDIKLKPFTNIATEAVGTAVDLPASKTLGFTEAEDFEALTGDDKTITSRGKGASVDWELESGGISLDVYKIIAGGTLTDSGVTPNQKRIYSKKATDARPFFRAEGQAMSDSGGDMHIVLYRCRATGDIEGEFGEGAFWVSSCSGQAFPSQAATTVDALYDFVQNEAETAIA